MPPVRRSLRDHAAVQPAVPVAAALLALLLLSLPWPHAGPELSYAARGRDLALLERLAGMVLVAAGVAAWLDGQRRVGLGALAAGLLWLLALLLRPSTLDTQAGWPLGHPTIRLVVVTLMPLLPVVLAGLIIALRGGVASRRARVAMLSVGGLGLLAGSLMALTYDHLDDPTCWADCAGSPVLRLGPSAVRGVIAIAFGAVSAGALVLLGGCIAWWRSRGSRIGGPAALAIGAGGAFAVGTLLLSLPSMLRFLGFRPMGLRPLTENPSDELSVAVFVVRATALVALAGAVIWRVAGARLATRRVRRLASTLEAAPRPGTLQAVLADSLGDPALRVRYWLEDEACFVAADGSVDDPGVSAGPRTLLRRGDRTVAVVLGSPGTDPGAVGRALGPAALAAVDNERLRSAVLFRIDALRTSRRRVVERADAERRRLEHDLHDGAQQRLLAISYDLRLARNEADRAGETEVAQAAEHAMRTIASAVEELRELAHGLHPAILDEEGLGPALEALAEETPVAVALAGTSDLPRFQAAVEVAAWQLVRDAAEEAARRGATHLAVVAAVQPDRLTLELADDGPSPGPGLVRATDRVRAAGGELEAPPDQPASGSRVLAWLPCG